MAARKSVKRTIKRSTVADDILLTDAYEEFIVTKEARNLSEATIRNYRYSFDKFIEFVGKDTTGNAVEVSMIYKWIATMKQDGIKHISISSYLSDVRVFMYWCMNTDRAYIPNAFKIELLKGQEESLKLFTEEEQELLIAKPPRKASFVEFRTWAIVNWVLATGNRASTICSIQIQDLQFARREIVLERHTKNNKAQIIPMSSSLETVIKEYIRMWRRDADPTGYLFCNVGETQLTTNALRHSFGKYCHDRGVNKSNIHGLRHTFAREWYLNGGDVVMLSKILGHSSIHMSEHYMNIYADSATEKFIACNPLEKITKVKRGATKTVKRND